MLVIIKKKHQALLMLIILFVFLYATYNVHRSRFMRIIPEGKKIILLSFNIHYGISANKKSALDEIAAFILEVEPDIVALQEVDRFWLRSLFIDQGKFLAEKTGMNYAYGPNIKSGISEFGNCILSKYPIEHVENIKMSSDKETRGLLIAKIRIKDILFTVLNTHLGLNSSERLRHIKSYILPYLQNNKGPIILAGDFNVEPGSSEVNFINEEAKDTASINKRSLVYTHPKTNKRIDYIFYVGITKLLSYNVIPLNLSDHYPILIEFEI